MKFTFNEEEILIQESARRFLASLTGIDQKITREKSAEGFLREEWREMAHLGWLGMVGNSSEEVHALGILSEEIGKSAFASPYIATACALRILAVCCGDTGPLTIDGVASGDTILTLVDPANDRAQISGEQSGNRITLTSARMIVDWLPAADKIVIPFRSEDRPGVAIVAATAAGVSIEMCGTFDNARAGFLTLSGVSPEWWGWSDSDALGEALKLGRLLRGAEAVGGARGALDLTADYVKERHQFGVALSSFQAIRQGLADVRAHIDSAWLVTWDGLSQAAKGEPIEGRAALAIWLAKRAFQESAIKGAQYHGGMGHVVDSHMQFFYRRAGTFHAQSPRDWTLLGDIAEYYVQPWLSDTPRIK